MNLLTWNSLYYHLLKYLLFLLKHPVYCSSHLFPGQLFTYRLYSVSHVFKLLQNYGVLQQFLFCEEMEK